MSKNTLTVALGNTVCQRCLMQRRRLYRPDAKLQHIGKIMNTQFLIPSATISMMISEAAYKAVVGIERAVRFCGKMLRSRK